MKKITRFVSMLLVCLTVLSFSVVPAMAATSSQFGSGNYCEVTISRNLLNKRGKQYAKVKLNTYNSDNATGRNTSGQVTVTMRDQYGNYIWSGVKKGGDTLKLGDDHSVYRIYVAPYDKPTSGWFGWKAAGDNFINRGKCVSWKFTNAKDCSIR